MSITRISILKYSIISFFLLSSHFLLAQGLVETELTANPLLIEKWQEAKSYRVPSITDTLSTLDTTGILDDFSYSQWYPDTALWLDKFVYVNRHFAYCPPTIGVATFDGLDQNGYPYDINSSASFVGVADYLTSKPIKLNYPAGDSIYLSFYFQPKGYGNEPEPTDSLVLEFKSPSDTSWSHMWSTPGFPLNFKDTMAWKLVMIPITQPAFLQKGFQFRFKNYATLTGSVDHWHVDYVYLNRNRSINDTLFEDVSFVYNTTSLLNNYSSMPWRQYDPSFSKTAVSALIRNNHNAQKNVTFKHKVFDKAGVAIFNSVVSGDNVSPFSSTGYYTYTAGNLPSFPLMTAPTSYSLEVILSTLPDKIKRNDTLRTIQKFSNYYAYDDGSAESAFGMSTYGGELAEQFTLTKADTLSYLDIFFNPILENSMPYTFNIKVWSDKNGNPDMELFVSDTAYNPVYTKTYNGFKRYQLKTPLYLNSGVFYIGFAQNIDKFLNIGVDKNTNTQDKIFYNVGNGWRTSSYKGSLLMHPVFGFDPVTGIKKIADIQKSNYFVYPNPVVDYLSIYGISTKNNNVKYSIIDMYGKVVLENITTINTKIDVSSLVNGIYFMRVVNDIQVATSKFIKIK
ncbi:MAG: T9SS type A sorting domain-containing protein [Bacteroidia bacterium]